VKWQVQNIPKTSASELMAGYLLLSEEKYTVPRESKLEFCKKIANNYAESGKWDQWMATLALDLPENEDFCNNPTFGLLLPSKSNEQQLAEFWSVFKSAVVNEGLIRLLDRSEQDGFDEMHDVASKFCTMAGKAQKDLPESGLPLCSLALLVIHLAR
jgi:hypothetical protein